VEKTGLPRNISTLNATIQKRDDTIAELNRRQDGLRGQLDLLKYSLEEENNKAAAANTAITKPQQSLKQRIRRSTSY
jgi:peptidoglycan hydrolase CwlO-like protein